ncbi:MAG: RnfABCDGE type electron transport complex subunit G [Lachnospiraceae bacterium]
MKSMIKDTLVLGCITLIAGLILGFVYDITKEPIEIQNGKKKNDACFNVFADATDFQEIEVIETEEFRLVLNEAGLGGEEIESVYKAVNSNQEELGYVLNIVTHSGYAGDIQFAMGISKDGIINGISLLSISETPGLGMNADDVIVPQFKDKKIDQFEVTKTQAVVSNQIDAISGATITSSAIVNGVNAGVYYFKEVLLSN